MAKTIILDLKGKAKWVRAKAPNKFGNWSHDLYPIPEDVEKIRELQAKGLKNVLKKDEDGYYCAWSRPTSKLIKGKVTGFAPPMIFQADGKTPMRDDILVGNGSDVTTRLEVYEHRVPGTEKKAVAARWLAMRVTNLIPFIPEKDFVPDEQRAAKGLDPVSSPAQSTEPEGWN